MNSLSEQDFRLRSDEALEHLHKDLMAMPEQEDFEIEFEDGVLYLLFEEPQETRFVVSPNAPMRQIWVSAMARGYKLSWAPDARAFVLSGETLTQLVERLTREFLRGIPT